MRNTTINKLGTYPSKLKLGDTQSLTFTYGDARPFYLLDEEREVLKFDMFSGEKKKKQKTKKMLVDEIKMTSYQIRGHLSKEKLERIAKLNSIALIHKLSVEKEGWMGKPKGLLQILWEQGFIDKNSLSSYSYKGRKSQMDEDGKLKEDFTKYYLPTLMKRCSNFANDKSAMEHLFLQLSLKAEQTISMLTSPKYHCKVAGEGVEFVWMMMKRCFRSIPYKEKDTKQ